MIAYLFKTKTGFQLTICAQPCNGPEFAQSPVVAVENKRAARAYCKAHNLTPWNF